MKTTRCVRCRSEFTDAEIENAKACPNCQATGVPMAIAQDVDLRINWHELRILIIWAENWELEVCRREGKSPGAIAAIAKALMPFRPEGAPALRLFDEVLELQDVFPSAAMHAADGATLIPPVPGSDKAN